jgi:hypothetical protein
MCAHWRWGGRVRRVSIAIRLVTAALVRVFFAPPKKGVEHGVVGLSRLWRRRGGATHINHGRARELGTVLSPLRDHAVVLVPHSHTTCAHTGSLGNNSDVRADVRRLPRLPNLGGGNHGCFWGFFHVSTSDGECGLVIGQFYGGSGVKRVFFLCTVPVHKHDQSRGRIPHLSSKHGKTPKQHSGCPLLLLLSSHQHQQNYRFKNFQELHIDSCGGRGGGAKCDDDMSRVFQPGNCISARVVCRNS